MYILAYTFFKHFDQWRCSYEICSAKILIQNEKNILEKNILLYYNYTS
jgi:hypothetical protein